MIELGSGANRSVYRIDDNFILKEAINMRGVVCNVMEVIISNSQELANNPYIVRHYFYGNTKKFVIRENLTPINKLRFCIPNDKFTEQLRMVGINDLDNYNNWFLDKNGNLKFGDYGVSPQNINPIEFVKIFQNCKCPFDDLKINVDL